MAKLTRRETKLHDEVMELVRGDESLTKEQINFILDNFKPHSNRNVTKLGAFFTPEELARSATIEMPDPADYDRPVRILDLCAGIGRLTHAYLSETERRGEVEVVCMEIDEQSIEVGKRLFPHDNVTWIQADIGDATIFDGMERFDCCISNPPYSKMINLTKENNMETYQRGAYLVAKRAMEIADYGVFIIPQCNCPFEVSGRDDNIKVHNPQYIKFEDNCLIRFAESCIDTSFANELWDGVSPIVEIVIVTNLRTDPYKLKVPELTM